MSTSLHWETGEATGSFPHCVIAGYFGPHTPTCRSLSAKFSYCSAIFSSLFLNLASLISCGFCWTAVRKVVCCSSLSLFIPLYYMYCTFSPANELIMLKNRHNTIQGQYRQINGISVRERGFSLGIFLWTINRWTGEGGGGANEINPTLFLTCVKVSTNRDLSESVFLIPF